MPKHCCTKNTKEARTIDGLALFIRAISEPNRLKILCLLKKGSLCVCDIYEALGIPQNLTSHHLKELRDAGLVMFQKKGVRVEYFRNELTIKRYLSQLKNIIG